MDKSSITKIENQKRNSFIPAHTIKSPQSPPLSFQFSVSLMSQLPPCPCGLTLERVEKLHDDGTVRLSGTLCQNTTIDGLDICRKPFGAHPTAQVTAPQG